MNRDKVATMKNKILGIGLLLCWLVPVGALASPLYSGLVVFGDSFSDSGNNAVIVEDFTKVPLERPDIIPTAPYRSGRYSNGPVWIEQLAHRMDLHARPSLLGGSNYAFGGAHVGPTSAGDTPTLLEQVDRFLSDTHGSAPADKLYVIAGGGNDARAALAAVAGSGGKLAIGLPYIEQYGARIASIVTTLHKAGATDFLIWNVPNIGLAPALPDSDAIRAAGASIAIHMNNLLDSALDSLSVEIPAIDLIRFDAFGLISSIVGNPQAFGLVNATFPCAVDSNCIANPDGYFFWDGVHPTTAGHSVIAQAVLPLITVPAPGSLGLVVLGLLTLAWARRIQRSRS